MGIVKKKTARKVSKKKHSTTVAIIESHISPEDTLFPEKVAHAKKVLSKAIFHDPRFGR